LGGVVFSLAWLVLLLLLLLLLLPSLWLLSRSFRCGLNLLCCGRRGLRRCCGPATFVAK
jgi:hypothetical protein